LLQIASSLTRQIKRKDRVYSNSPILRRLRPRAAKAKESAVDESNANLQMNDNAPPDVHSGGAFEALR
jgi:hypothetical protein